MSVHLRTKWFYGRISLLSLKPQIWHLLRATSSVTFRQTTEWGFTLKLLRDRIITYRLMHDTDKYSQHSSIIWPFWRNDWVFIYELSGCWFESRCSHLNLRYVTCFQQSVPRHWGKLCGFTLKPVSDMIITYSQMHRTDKKSQQSSIVWPVWENGWVFIDELSGCGFESCCCYLNLRYGAWFEQGVPWHSGKL